jgi:hypothetical protein
MMDGISRRQIVRGAAATAVATTFGTASVHAERDRQTMRFVPHAELKISANSGHSRCRL